MVGSYYNEEELKTMVKDSHRKLLRQRGKAVNFAIEYLLSCTQQKVCDFINSGKLDINDE